MSHIPGDLGDARFINYLLEYNYRFLLGEYTSYWDASFMYPYKNAIAISDNMLGTTPIYSLWRWLGFQQETAYQLWWLTICTLNYWLTYFVVKKWFGKPELALLAAYIFAFTVYNIPQLNYVQMSIRFMVPVAFYAVVKLIDTGLPKYLFYILLAITYQLYCVMYTGVFLFYFLFGFSLIYVIVTQKQSFIKKLFSKTNYVISILLILMSGLALGTLLYPYLKSSGEVGLRLYDEIKGNIPVFSAFLFPDQSSVIWGFMNETMRPTVADWWLQSTFIGMIPLLAIPIAAFVLWKNKTKGTIKDPLLLALLITITFITVFFSRSESGYTLYPAIFKLPGMAGIRVIHRYMHVVLFLIIAVLIILLKEKPKSWIYTLLLLSLVDNSFNSNKVCRTEKSEIVERRIYTIEKVKPLILNKNYKAFAILNTEEEFYKVQLDAMIASLYCDLPTINGYSSSSPPDYWKFFGKPNKEGLDYWMEKKGMNKEDILIVDLDSK